jgi:hypothetical protein
LRLASKVSMQQKTSTKQRHIHSNRIAYNLGKL